MYDYKISRFLLQKFMIEYTGKVLAKLIHQYYIFVMKSKSTCTWKLFYELYITYRLPLMQGKHTLRSLSMYYWISLYNLYLGLCKRQNATIMNVVIASQSCVCLCCTLLSVSVCQFSVLVADVCAFPSLYMRSVVNLYLNIINY